jgi:hypothetical protein
MIKKQIHFSNKCFTIEKRMLKNLFVGVKYRLLSTI